MVKRNFFIYNEQDKFLRHLGGNASEHVRRALDDYRERIQNRDATTSPSPKMKILRGGEEVTSI